ELPFPMIIFTLNKDSHWKHQRVWKSRAASLHRQPFCSPQMHDHQNRVHGFRADDNEDAIKDMDDPKRLA
ncbi:hypothetical protein BaRGS_00013296, partial [Batillaria attramentaria]